jgi:hypothetical protein
MPTTKRLGSGAGLSQLICILIRGGTGTERDKELLKRLYNTYILLILTPPPSPHSGKFP